MIDEEFEQIKSNAMDHAHKVLDIRSERSIAVASMGCLIASIALCKTDVFIDKETLQATLGELWDEVGVNAK